MFVWLDDSFISEKHPRHVDYWSGNNWSWHLWNLGTTKCHSNTKSTILHRNKLHLGISRI